MVIKTQRGLGDAVYCFPVVEHYARTQSVKVITKYPIVFDSLYVDTTDDYRTKYDLFPRYETKSEKNQYLQILHNANLKDIPLKLKWKYSSIVKFEFKYTELNDKNICVVKEPCAAHMHKASKNLCVSPSASEMQQFINENKNKYFFVSVGQSEIFKQRLEGINLDLNDKMSVEDLISLCYLSSFIISQVGHLIVLAQALDIDYKVFYPEVVTTRNSHITKKIIE